MEGYSSFSLHDAHAAAAAGGIGGRLGASTPGRARGDKPAERGLSARCPNTPGATPMRAKTPNTKATPWTAKGGTATTPATRSAARPAAGARPPLSAIPPASERLSDIFADDVPDIEFQTHERKETLRPVDVTLDDPLADVPMDLRLPLYRCCDEPDWGIAAPEI